MSTGNLSLYNQHYYYLFIFLEPQVKKEEKPGM